jgi:Tfp pilus assembly protein PilF
MIKARPRSTLPSVPDNGSAMPPSTTTSGAMLAVSTAARAPGCAKPTRAMATAETLRNVRQQRPDRAGPRSTLRASRPFALMAGPSLAARIRRLDFRLTPLSPLHFTVMRSARRFTASVALGALVALALPLHAQPTTDEGPTIAVPPELSDTARRAYSQSLREAADLLAKKEYVAATTKLDAMIAERPREPQARFLKGIAQTEQGQQDAAFTTFRGLVEDYPELPEPHNNLAVLYAQKGEYDIARSELELALKTAPDWAIAHENLGDIYARLAANHYDRAGTLDKSNKTAPAKLALVRQLLTPAPPKPKS